MKKILSLIAVSTLGTVIGTTTGLSTLESMTSQINNFNNSSTFKTDINDGLQNTNLGEIETNNVSPTLKQVEEAILANNPTLKIDAVTISNITNTSAKVTGDNKLYTGSVNVVYTVVL